MTFFDQILSTIKRKPKTKRAFGKNKQNWGNYSTLKVIPKSKRVKGE